ncbi:MAG: class I SAM-dependent methyltransferase [Phycisphaerae bacterium]|nr:class I SAM-dependent methyltransferase [Phycisphaerae bacterium]
MVVRHHQETDMGGRGRSPGPRPAGDLTTAQYWGERQSGAALTPKKLAELHRISEWFDAVRPYLAEYEGQRLLELGCSPGYASAVICTQLRFQPSGVDFSPEAGLYPVNLAAVGVKNATLYPCDIRDFSPPTLYDVVCSVGLVEHFSEPKSMLSEHSRLLRQGGLMVVVVPNFRKVPFLYHWVFDRRDLVRHNLACMEPRLFEDFSREHGFQIVLLRHVGRLRLWGLDASGSRFGFLLRRCLAKLVREIGRSVGYVLPANHPLFAPFLAYVGRKL